VGHDTNSHQTNGHRKQELEERGGSLASFYLNARPHVASRVCKVICANLAVGSMAQQSGFSALLIGGCPIDVFPISQALQGRILKGCFQALFLQMYRGCLCKTGGGHGGMAPEGWINVAQPLSQTARATSSDLCNQCHLSGRGLGGRPTRGKSHAKQRPRQDL